MVLMWCSFMGGLGSEYTVHSVQVLDDLSALEEGEVPGLSPPTTDMNGYVVLPFSFLHTPILTAHACFETNEVKGVVRTGGREVFLLPSNYMADIHLDSGEGCQGRRARHWGEISPARNEFWDIGTPCPSPPSARCFEISASRKTTASHPRAKTPLLLFTGTQSNGSILPPPSTSTLLLMFLSLQAGTDCMVDSFLVPLFFWHRLEYIQILRGLIT